MKPKLLPCIYTGSRTAWRREDGEPAINETAARLAFASDPRKLEELEKGGFGVVLDGAPRSERLTTPAKAKAKRKR